MDLAWLGARGEYYSIASVSRVCGGLNQAYERQKNLSACATAETCIVKERRICILAVALFENPNLISVLADKTGQFGETDPDELTISLGASKVDLKKALLYCAQITHLSVYHLRNSAPHLPASIATAPTRAFP